MPYDKAMIESFLTNLKLEISDGRPLPSREQARTAIFEYIELLTNRAQPHSALGYATPLQIEQQYEQIKQYK